MKNIASDVFLWIAVVSLLMSLYYVSKGNYAFGNIYVTMFMGNVVLYKLCLEDDPPQ